MIAVMRRLMPDTLVLTRGGGRGTKEQAEVLILWMIPGLALMWANPGVRGWRQRVRSGCNETITLLLCGVIVGLGFEQMVYYECF